MILPTKRLGEDRALLKIGAEIIKGLDESKTVSRLWDELQQSRNGHAEESVVTYDWFILSLDLLYALGTIELEHGRIHQVKP
ncbi:ABC-three component system middle component 6 [Chloroflexota bacterium]